MFLIVAVCGAVGGLLTLIVLLIMIVAIRREDRTPRGVHSAPRSLSGALARQVSGLHVIDRPDPVPSGGKPKC